MSIIKADTLQDRNGNPLVSVANGVASGSFAPVGMRNRIINGDMRIDQRNAGASQSYVSGSSAYSLDRWGFDYSQTSKFTTQQNAGSVTPPNGFASYLGVTSSSAYSVTSNDYFFMEQRVEGLNVSDLGWGTANAEVVTISFWVRSSLTGIFGGALRNSAATRSYPFTYTISAANTWEYKTITIPGDTSGTWLVTNGIGIRLAFSLGVGSTYSGTAGAWSGSNLGSSTGAVSVVGTNGATFYITGIQLEAGIVATPFERRQFGQELALCQRYFEDVKFGATGAGRWVSQDWTGYVSYAVTKRVTPTVSFSGSVTTFANSSSGTTSSLSVWQGGTNGFGLRAIGGASDYQSAIIRQDSAVINASAEL
jgi:hypothetical protein